MGFDITSPGNERIKWLVRLRERRYRDTEGLFVVEGERLFSRAVAAGLRPEVVLTDGTVELEADVVTVEPSVLDKASYRARSEGVIAVFPQFRVGLEAIEISRLPLLLIVEGIEKPGNLGAMMRTGAAARVDALITVGSTVDPFNPNVLRASTGAVFTLSLAVSNWEELLPWMERRGIGLVGASPDGAVRLWEADLSLPVALVVGAEDTGLSERAKSVVNQTVVIPQSEAGVDSLNASAATAVVLFEAVRQRGR